MWYTPTCTLWAGEQSLTKENTLNHIGILTWFKAYSLIEEFWKLWEVFWSAEARGLVLGLWALLRGAASPELMSQAIWPCSQQSLGVFEGCPAYLSIYVYPHSRIRCTPSLSLSCNLLSSLRLQEHEPCTCTWYTLYVHV